MIVEQIRALTQQKPSSRVYAVRQVIMRPATILMPVMLICAWLTFADIHRRWVARRDVVMATLIVWTEMFVQPIAATW